MSFYTDYESTATSQEHDNNTAFVCLNCGGTDSYLDSATGILCCDSCFTQSQTIAPSNEDVMDVEEVQGLAARTKFGALIGVRGKNSSSRRTNTKKRTDARTKQETLQELDQSVPLPNLVTCLHGIQRVLQQSVECIGELLDLNDQQRTSLQSTLHKLWRSYLHAWTDGAEYYAKRHPQVRFSLRDAFITKHYKNLLLRHLTHQCSQAIIKKEQEDESKPNQNALLDDDSSDCSDDEKIDSEEDERLQQPSVRETAPVENGRGNQQTNNNNDTNKQYRYQKEYSKVISLLNTYAKAGHKGRKEAALRLQPSMTFCASLLWLALIRLGVTARHVASWISNGSLPLLNAHDLLLSPEERRLLKPIAHVFRMPNVPSTNLLEFNAELLVVACGLKSYEHLTGGAGGSTTNDSSQQSSVKNKLNNKEKRKQKGRITLISPDTVPLMTARLVSDLGLGQSILDTCLALMGILDKKNVPSDIWLPASLPAAHPTKLTKPAHILGVIAVACKMCPGWESWSFGRGRASSMSMASTKEQSKQSTVEEESSYRSLEESEEEKTTRKRRRDGAKSRFVPWNEEQFRLLGNGPMLEGYLDFIEDMYVNHEEILPGFQELMSSLDINDTTGSFNREKDVSACTDVMILPNPVLAGGHNPNRPKMWRRQKHHDWYLKLAKRRAQWADANGLGEYVIYTNRKSHALAKATRFVKAPGNNLTPEPFHPHYGLLIEYMSYKANVEPSEIHAMVAGLDEDVARSIRPKPPPKKKRRTTCKAGKEKEQEETEDKEAKQDPGEPDITKDETELVARLPGEILPNTAALDGLLMLHSGSI